MKTLVIHPEDKTTDFLSEIYKEENWTIVRKDLRKSELRSLIKEHEKIIMLGHGLPQGLLGHNKILIDSSYVNLLREKELVCIWCNADQFVLKYDLSGFYTGMIISEIEEADYLGIVDCSMQEVYISNKLFSYAVKESLKKDDVVLEMKDLYNSFINKVVDYNRNNLYFRTSKKKCYTRCKGSKIVGKWKIKTISSEEFLNQLNNK